MPLSWILCIAFRTWGGFSGVNRARVVGMLVFKRFNSSMRVSKWAASLPCFCLCWCQSHPCMRQMNASDWQGKGHIHPNERGKSTFPVTLWNFHIHTSGCMVMTSFGDINICPIRPPPPCTCLQTNRFDSSHFSSKPLFSLSIIHIFCLCHPYWSLSLKTFCSAYCSDFSCLDTCTSRCLSQQPEFHIPVHVFASSQYQNLHLWIIYVIMHTRTCLSRLQDALKKERNRMSNPPDNIRRKPN